MSNALYYVMLYQYIWRYIYCKIHIVDTYSVGKKIITTDRYLHRCVFKEISMNLRVHPQSQGPVRTAWHRCNYLALVVVRVSLTLQESWKQMRNYMPMRIFCVVPTRA